MRGFKLSPFTGAEWLFSIKSFAAAMLAMYLSSRAGLARPFWALMTAYIVANPLAGAVRSKALYRFLGTLLGSVAALLMIPAFNSAPVLLTLSIALWIAFCLYVSLLDRTPRAYLFMLAGYTAAMVGLPNIETPNQMFDNAVFRVEEIGLGIFCASVIHSVFWPQGMAPRVLGLMDKTLADGRRWLEGLLQHQAVGAAGEESRLTAERRRLAADITQLRLLSTHVPYDTTHLRWTAGAVRAMQDRVAALTPHLSAVEDRLRALVDASGQLPADVRTLLDEVAAWLQLAGTQIEPRDEARTTALRQRLHMFPDADDAGVDGQASIGTGHDNARRWQHALRIGLALRLEELVDDWLACERLRQDIDAGLSGAAAPLRQHRAVLSNFVLHRDHGMALLSAVAAALAVAICCGFWLLTGWTYGYVAAMMAAVFCSLFAAMDDPVPAMHGFLKWTLWSVPLSTLYVLVLLPLVQDFGMLVLICAPLLLVLGCLIARPATFTKAMPLFFGVAGTLAMHDTSSADLVSFINFMTAEILGVVIAARTTRLIRSVGAQWSARRIQRSIWHELSQMAAADTQMRTDAGYAVRMLDRIGLLAPRIAQSGGSIEGVVANDALRDLRVGADLATLQCTRRALPSVPVGAVLAPLALFFEQRASGRNASLASTLVPAIDQAIDAVLDLLRPPQGQSPAGPPTQAPGVSGSTARGGQMLLLRQAMAALVGLRRNLMPQAPAALSAAPIQERTS